MSKNAYTGNVLDQQMRETLKSAGEMDLSKQRGELENDTRTTAELERQFREMELLMEQRKREKEKASETKEKTERLQSEV